MAKNLDVIMLFDIYGEMLTEKQQEIIGYYYNDDLSLSEIAENEGITRQGVHDAIKRAVLQLEDFERHLGLRRRFEQTQKGLEEIRELNEKIKAANRSSLLSRDINDATAQIGVIVRMLLEQ